MDADLGFLSKDQMPSTDFNLPEDFDNAKSSCNTISENCNDLFHGKSNDSSSTSTSISMGIQTVLDGKSGARAEAQIAESEQATYTSANNDLKGTKAYQEADVPGLFNLAMAIIDYRGHRVVGQVCGIDVFFFCLYLLIFFVVDGLFCILICWSLFFMSLACLILSSRMPKKKKKKSVE